MEQKPAESSGKKYDDEKVMLQLLSPIALTRTAEVLTVGMKKYGAHNWRGGIAWTRVIGAALGHIFAYLRGEDRDLETGLSHLAHASCCLMFLLEYEETHKEHDDRYRTVQAVESSSRATLPGDDKLLRREESLQQNAPLSRLWGG